MWFQTIHKKKLLGGMLARIPDSTFDWFRATPVVSDIFALEETSGQRRPQTRTAEDIATFIRSFRIGYVLIAPEYRGSALERYVDDNFTPFIVSRDEFDRFVLLTLRPPAWEPR